MLKLYKILEEVESPVNGKIQVVKSFEGIRILAGGISQSGWLVRKIWDVALKKVKEEKASFKKVLILGLGAGSAAELVSHYFPDAEIIGVDKDPLMVNLGRKYLHLANIPKLKIVEADGAKFVGKAKKGSFDLVLADIYVGSQIPYQFKAMPFLQSVEKILKPDGVACFNHLYSNIEKENAYKLHKKLRKIFPVITQVRPEANIVFICYKLEQTLSD